MQEYFCELADFVQEHLARGEEFTAWLSGECSDFVRFNRGRVRQAGEVRQDYLTLRLIREARQVSATLPLVGTMDVDGGLLITELGRLRDQLNDVSADPLLLLNRDPVSTERVDRSVLPPAEDIVGEVLDAAEGYDLVGILALGPVYQGFANALGQRNWHQSATFNVDWSLYADGDKAVKSTYAGSEWVRGVFGEKCQRAAAQLDGLRAPPRTISAGEYRAYLAPAALAEIIGLLNWGGFSEKALRSKRSPLIRLAEGEVSLNPRVSLSERPAEGFAPGFQSEGFLKPDRVDLIRDGRYAGSLVSPRTAREYDIPNTGAGSGETAESLRMAAGDLARKDALARLGTGLYISNLWYLNYSDRAACRLTGMTRFATFWVEDGKLAAPLHVMRFDDSVFRLLGSHLEALTEEREFIADANTYGSRHGSSRLLPGALVTGLRLVL